MDACITYVSPLKHLPILVRVNLRLCLMVHFDIKDTYCTNSATFCISPYYSLALKRITLLVEYRHNKVRDVKAINAYTKAAVSTELIASEDLKCCHRS